MVHSAPAGGGAGAPQGDALRIGQHEFKSRLFVGTGKYRSFDEMARALDASGTDCVTVAVRRAKLGDPKGGGILDFIDRKRYTLLPNTAGCYTTDDAVRTAMLAREAGLSNLIKLEVLGDEQTLLPDPIATLEASKILVKEGFDVFVYTSDDPILARRLEDAGVAAVMPAGSPIGSGQGILNPLNIRLILDRARIPVIVDAGVGTASDVTIAMELGIAGVLLNTAIAAARDPEAMARAMRLACEAGRLAWCAGRMPRRSMASASSPTEGMSPKG